ncbi:MAG TPA: PAS domain S-box protein [Verrucomicrobiae bacterium]|jgi:PAS domain S-box-containing protein|nr:PAS domain S-box protein [Verrucomicrobiae bacterium]
MKTPLIDPHWDERTSAPEPRLKQDDGVFESFFERTFDAVWLFDPEDYVFVDCNQAAIRLLGANSKDQLLGKTPEDLSPATQPSGASSLETSTAIVALIEKHKGHRFEWVARRMDGHEIPLEVSGTAIIKNGRRLNVIIARDISERKKAEQESRESNHLLERRVVERTAALTTSEARFRAMVEHAPEAIVVFDGNTGHFLFGNEHACRLYGVPMYKLTTLTPADVSPEFQPNGRRSDELARELMAEALADKMPVFEWIHQQAGGRLIATEVRLLRLPAEGQNLIRASILDTTERKESERALRESEAKFRALFEGSSHGVVLHDHNALLEVNSAAVRIMGRQHAHEMVGKDPRSMAPPFQPNGESSAELGQRNIEECLAHGSARFEWVALAPDGREIPLEVALTRIQWSGREIIQAYITDITERKRAQVALAESEALFSAAIQASPIFIGVTRLSDGHFVLVNDAFVNWSGYARHEILGRNTLELGTWEDASERLAFLTDLNTAGSVRERECRFRNRAGQRFTMLISCEVIQLNHVPHMLGMALDITERKRAEAELRESERRFSAAFQASPAFIAILRMSDERYVLANDAYLNWLGYPLDEVIGRTCVELGLWEDTEDRDSILKDMQAHGSIRQRECRWRNRRGDQFTILLSAETIQLNDTPHMLSMALDITQRKRAEEELLNTLEREKELSQLKGNFVSMVSHEFRTPLGIIQSSAELLREFHPRMQTGERNEQLDSIARNTRRMAGMMEDILILSRLDAGKLEFQPAALDLNAFCSRVVDEVLSATNNRCAIKWSLKSTLSKAKADERLLGHILTNLLSNAVKYSEPGATVHLNVERDGCDVVCTIRDEGIGISQLDQQHLFKAFHRGNNVGTRPGTGLGLLLVKRCAELHGGNVQVNSEIGRGTIVRVTLPIFAPNHEKNIGH